MKENELILMKKKIELKCKWLIQASTSRFNG